MGDLRTLYKVEQQIASVLGFRVAGVKADLKKNDTYDMTLIVADRDCVAAGVFTTNQAKAAPVLVSQEHLVKQAAHVRAVIINTASANAMTGRVGIENARTVARMVAEKARVQTEQVLVMSTGVIGAQLPMPKIQQGITTAFEQLGSDWNSAARGIMTTDTRPKTACITIRTVDGEYTIAGISKGAGMIAPHMATMLGVIVTDARLTLAQAQTALQTANEISFNRIVVDGDTSTNDTVFLLANGASGCDLKTSADVNQFQQALCDVARSLAQQIVRDGEGATKFITLHITGADSDASAHTIAHTIAASPLVKTAFFGNDANWGRMIAAAGRAGVPFDPDTTVLSIAAGEHAPLEKEPGVLILFQQGMPTHYSEAQATAIFSQPSVYVALDLGRGDGAAVVWTCDLSHEYVSINGDYRS